LLDKPGFSLPHYPHPSSFVLFFEKGTSLGRLSGVLILIILPNSSLHPPGLSLVAPLRDPALSIRSLQPLILKTLLHSFEQTFLLVAIFFPSRWNVPPYVLFLSSFPLFEIPPNSFLLFPLKMRKLCLRFVFPPSLHSLCLQFSTSNFSFFVCL